jgi:dTDP-4-dehydrorhamnose reductase
MPKKTLILGASGFIGSHLFKFLKQSKHEVFGTSFSQKSDNFISINLSKKKQIKDLMADIQPDIVIFLAASKDVVKCQSDPNYAIESNIFMVQNYLNACSELDIDPFTLYLSTDYVFSGENGYYLDVCPVSPSTVYGMTKAISERLFLNASNNSIVLRVSAVMSPLSGFYAMVKNALETKKYIEMFDNVVFSPTSIINLSNYILYLLETPPSNRIIHFSDGYRMSRYDFALSVADFLGSDKRLINPVNVNFHESIFQKDLSLIPTGSSEFKQGSYVCDFKGLVK